MIVVKYLTFITVEYAGKIRKTGYTAYHFIKMVNLNQLKSIQIYYRNASYYHPKCRDPELLTFTQATLYFPLVYLALLFLPTIVYVLLISCRKYGIKVMFQKFVDNIVFSIFALVTNISFYKRSRDISKDIVDDIDTKNKQRSKSVSNLKNIQSNVYRCNRSASLNSLPQISKDIGDDTKYKNKQSSKSVPNHTNIQSNAYRCKRSASLNSLP